jgi:DNA-binding NarL/FixJ family response regulator
MPNLDGVAATGRLTSPGDGKPAKVLAITTFDLDEYVVEALRAGASGFLLKDATPEELVHAVRVIGAGNALLAPTVTKRLLDRYARRLPPATPEDTQLLDKLTNRELAVLNLVARGHSNAEIGQELHLAETTVKTHVAHLLAKLGLADRVHIVVFAYESGLVKPGTI